MNVETKKKIDINSKEKTILNRLLNKFNVTTGTVLIILFFLLIIIFFNLLWMRSAKQYQILYNNLSNDDREAIVSQLIHMNIPYRFNEHSGILLVPENQVYDIRLQLSEQNLPKSSNIGFELLDQEKFGISQFNEQINYQRALEGELARTIERLRIVTQAKVHIALPKSSLFIRDMKEPTASVILNLRSGTYLTRDQINGILHLVASSVSGLRSSHITIIDQFGKLLNDKNNLYYELNEIQFKYSEIIEKRYKKYIEDILTPIVGSGNVYAQVTAQIDFNNQEKIEEKYEPNVNILHQAIRSHQSSDKLDIDEKNIDGSLSGVLNHHDNSKNNSKFSLSKLKKITNKQKNRSNILTQSQKHHDDTINYELDHTFLHKKMKTGELKRLSAAVVINFIKNNKGNLVPLNIKKINQIKKLTCNAIGYSKERGDSVNVVNALFVQENENKISNKFLTESKIEHIIEKKILNNNPKNNFIKFHIFSLFNITRLLFFIIALLLIFILYHFFILKKLLKQKSSEYVNIQCTEKKSQENTPVIYVKDKTQNVESGYNKKIKNQSIDIIKKLRKWMSEDKL